MTAAGTIKVSTVSTSTGRLQRLGIRANPYAAIAEITSVATVCTTATTNELSRLRASWTLSLANRRRRLCRLGSAGTHTQRDAASSWEVAKALRRST